MFNEFEVNSSSPDGRVGISCRDICIEAEGCQIILIFRVHWRFVTRRGFQ